MNNRQKMVGFLCSNGVDEKDAWAFLWLINASISLNGFYQVCQNLLQILPLLKKYSVDFIETEYFKIWEEICRLVEENEKHLRDEFGDKISAGIDPKNDRPPTYGEIGMSPIFCALYHEIEDDHYEKIYEQIASIILVCQIYALKDFSDLNIENYKINCGENYFGHLISSFRKVSQTLRSNTYKDQMDFILRFDEIEIKSVGSFYKIVLHLENEDPYDQEINSVRVFLDRTVSTLDPENWGSSGNGGGSSGSRKYGFGPLNQNEDINFSPKSNDRKSYKINKFPPGFKDEWQDAGLEFDELFDELFEQSDGDEIFESDEKDKANSSNKVIREAQRQFIGLRNNFLTTEWSRFTKNESQIIFQSLMKGVFDITQELNRSSEYTASKLLNLEARTLMVLLVVTGAKYNDVSKCNVLNNKQTQGTFLAYLNEQSCVRIMVRFPPKKKKILQKTKPFIEKMIDHLLIPIPLNLINSFALISKIHGLVINKKLDAKRSLRLFKSDSKLLRKECIKIIKAELKSDRIKVTIKSLEKLFQYELITAFGGDVASVEMISGSDSLGPRSQHHYVMPTPRFLERGYLQSLANLNKKDYAPPLDWRNSDEVRVTNRVCVKTSSIVEALRKLERSYFTYKQSTNIDKLIEAHNNLTLYVLIGFLLISGYRFSINPTSDPKLITRDGFLKFGDKLSEDCYQIRMAYIPKLIRAQLVRYKIDRHRILRRLLTKFSYPKDSFDYATFLFFINPKTYEPEEVRPASWDEYASNVFPVPMNFARSYMRSKLMMDNCPVDTQRAYLGHVWEGVESYGQFSALSPLAYKQSIKPYFDSLLKEIGYKVI